MQALKALVNRKKHQVILMPSFRSYADFILISYLHVIYEIDLPFIAGLEKYDEVSLYQKVLRRCGGFWVDERKLQSTLYKVVLEEYFAQIMKRKHILEYHIERNRERSGKIGSP